MKKNKLFYLFLVFASVFAVACDEDEITSELMLSQNKVALMPTESVTVKVKTGNGGYVAKSADSNIAEAVFNKTANELKITAVKAGKTTVSVTDNKGKKAMVEVVVKAVLALEKSAVDVVEGGEAVVAITSGSGKYAVTSSKYAVAKATIDGTNVKITGVAKGDAIVTVKDTDTNVEKKINVVVKSDLAIGTDSVEIVEGGEKVVEITKGTGNYTVASADKNIATAAVNGNKIAITAVAAGTTKVTVTDTETNSTVDINVLVKPALNFGESEVTLFENEEKIITIDKGTGNYAAVSSKEEVATVTVDGKNIKIKAVAKGEAVVTVTDTETNKKKEVKVTVKARLALEKTELTINQGETERVAVVNVVDDKYEIVVEPTDALKVEKGGTDYQGSYVDALVITPLKYNKEAVKVTVKSGKQEAVLMVTINPVEAIKIAKKEVALKLGAKEEVRIIKGNGGYNIEVDNGDIVAAEIKLKQEPNQTPEYVVELKAKALGTANVKVTDVAGKEVTVKVTVEEGLKLEKNELTVNIGETEQVDVFNVVDGKYDVEVVPADVLKVEKGRGVVAPDGLKITPLKYSKDEVKIVVKSGAEEAVLMVTVNPIDTINVEKTETELMVGNTEEIRIISGNGDYKVTVDKEDFVEAEIKMNGSDYIIALKAKAIGVANVTVTDALGKKTTIKVTVKEEEEGLKLEKNELTINVGETQSVAVLDVTNNIYDIVAEPADVLKIAKGSKGSYINALIITPLKYSANKVKVTVKSGAEEAVLMVTVNPIDTINVEKTETELMVGDTEDIKIVSGNGDYKVTVDEEDFLEAAIKMNGSDYVVALEAKAVGVANVTVTDAADKTVTIKVTVKEAPLFNIDENGLVYKKEGAIVKGDIVIPDEGLVIAGFIFGEKTSPFAANPEVTSIDFNNVTEIRQMALMSCTALKVVRFRKLEKFSGMAAFSDCTALKEVYCYMEDPSAIIFGGYDFSNTPSDKILYVPAASLDAYKASGFKDFFSPENIRPME